MIKQVKIKNRVIGEGIPKVCVPLVGKCDEDILTQADLVLKRAEKNNIDIVEFRGDYYENLNDMKKLGALLRLLRDKLQNIILLFTVRSESEGGEKLCFDSPSIYEINHYVIEECLADIVDVELFSGADRIVKLVQLAHERDIKIIMSNHDFNTTPDAVEIVNRLRMMQDLNADIAKIAVMPENKMQLLSLLAATETMNSKYAKIPIVTISMGKLGALSRICGQIFGSAITFASLAQASAPGQIPVEEMNNLLEKVQEYM